MNLYYVLMCMVNRMLMPGSECIYLKLYSGYRTSEKILLKYMFPFLLREMGLGNVKYFFFIRYADPDFHIRLRIFVRDKEYVGRILINVYSVLEIPLNSGELLNLQIDTYKREIERYGERTIELTERFFCYDSVSMLYILKYIVDNDDVIVRDNIIWKVSLKLIDDILSVFSYSIEKKVDFMCELSRMFKMEFGFDGDSRYERQLNDKYRQLRSDAEKVINNGIDIAELDNVISVRKEQIGRCADVIKQHFSGDLNSYVRSLIHMTMNRIFRTKNRKNELVAYHIMCKCYKTMLYLKGNET